MAFTFPVTSLSARHASRASSSGRCNLYKRANTGIIARDPRIRLDTPISIVDAEARKIYRYAYIATLLLRASRLPSLPLGTREEIDRRDTRSA